MRVGALKLVTFPSIRPGNRALEWTTDRHGGKFTRTDMLFLSLPLDIWETIFELLPGQDLQSISKVGLPTPLPDASLTYLVIFRSRDYVASSRSHEDQHTDSRFTGLG